ncbi:type II toxin-antitoxin system prevent-host-death family antitoxin [Paracoccus sp. DMF]
MDLARAEPVAVAKHGRQVVVVMAIEEYERLKTIEAGRNASQAADRTKE